MSVVEVYCERVRDLLNPEKDNLQVSVVQSLQVVDKLLAVPLMIMPIKAPSLHKYATHS